MIKGFSYCSYSRAGVHSRHHIDSCVMVRCTGKQAAKCVQIVLEMVASTRTQSIGCWIRLMSSVANHPDGEFASDLSLLQKAAANVIQMLLSEEAPAEQQQQASDAIQKIVLSDSSLQQWMLQHLGNKEVCRLMINPSKASANQQRIVTEQVCVAGAAVEGLEPQLSGTRRLQWD